jgi:hypothetical protein
MKIVLRNLIPIPVKELQHDDSEVWEVDQFLFEQGKSYLLHAWSGKRNKNCGLLPSRGVFNGSKWIPFQNTPTVGSGLFKKSRERIKRRS